MATETKGTVLVALGANLLIALAKAAGGAVTGSSALLSEAAHSFADTFNEVFLLLSLRKGAKPADRTHPFGYGKERFFWSLLAAVGIFVSGAGFSAYQGVEALLGHPPEPSRTEFLVVYVVLAVSLVLEGGSLVKALGQVRREAREANRAPLDFVRRSPDPTVKTGASEDTVAVVGVLVALVGTALHQLTGSVAWDAAASLVIAGLLAYVAFVLGRDTKELLIGESADPGVRLSAYDALVGREEVVGVKELLTMQLGPSAVLVGARVQFVETLTAGQLERVCTEIEQAMHRRVPDISQVFLDPSRVEDGDAERGQAALALTRRELADLEGAAAPGGLRTSTGRRCSGRP